MNDSILDFYDSLAPYYHLIFEDWDKSIERQGAILNSLLEAQLGAGERKILDCACGIGTQAIGLARRGHQVVGSDLSVAAVERARREAAGRGLHISFLVSDMTSLAEIEERDFDVVLALDNALPHLAPEGLKDAVCAVSTKLRPGGIFLASTRDYDALMRERPTVQGPSFYGEAGERRIVHQVWDWIDGERYALHMYITHQTDGHWETHHFVSEYRCLQRGELSRALASAGLERIRWLMPDESGFYQPIVVARKSEVPIA
ncbi:MAG TPA: methyltransferase domain-containing protein [Terracidiphilus sp.]